MDETLELPNGDVVTPEDVFLHDGYPYRYVPAVEEPYAFAFSPLYWGDSGMDIPFRDRETLAAQWSDDSRGELTPDEWVAWLEDARDDDRFGDEEVAALARELPVDTAAVDPEASTGESASDGGILATVRGLLGI